MKTHVHILANLTKKIDILFHLLQTQRACMFFSDGVFLASWVEKSSSCAPVSLYVWSPEAFFGGWMGWGGGVFLLCLHKLNYSRQHISAARNQTTVLDGLMEKKILEEGKSENEISLGRIYVFYRSSKQNHFLWSVKYFLRPF